MALFSLNFHVLVQFDKWKSQNILSFTLSFAFVDILQISLYKNIVKLKKQITGDLLYQAVTDKADALNNLCMEGQRDLNVQIIN